MPTTCLLAVEPAERRLAVPVDGGYDQILGKFKALAGDAGETPRLHLHLVLHFEQVLVDKGARQWEFMEDLLHLLVHANRILVEIALHIFPARKLVF